MSFSRILKSVAKYYSEKVATHGPTARGVDWNSPESQVLRFEQLLKVCDSSTKFSINDYGCGYGALADYLSAQGWAFRYRGFDISRPMIAHAKELHKGTQHCDFFCDEAHLSIADYTVASGIFNVKLEASDEDWKAYMLQEVGKIAELSVRGFAFNALTMYADPERMRPGLYYADALFWFDCCKRHYSRNVALLHDYGLYEFTIIVRKEGDTKLVRSSSNT